MEDKHEVWENCSRNYRDNHETEVFYGKMCGYGGRFSHIYIEESIAKSDEVRQIVAHFPNAHKILIHHYKDVFNRRSQNTESQHHAQALILARKEGNLIYEGAPVCQSFGNMYFYYTSCVMNCLYDCEYCYLKGMYPSGHMVLFVNLEDIFAQVNQLLQKHPVYLCISYDTDLLALEGLTGFVQRWIDFTKAHAELKIEIRTKCARTDLWEKFDACDRVIFAYTMSPECVVKKYEKGTGALQERILAAKEGIRRGFAVRLCFDPMLYVEHWKQEYQDMVEAVFREIAPEEIVDVSVGSFRISQDYLKKMRKAASSSAVVQFPYENRDGVYQYPEGLRQEMENYLQGLLTEYISPDRIFVWG